MTGWENLGENRENPTNIYIVLLFQNMWQQQEKEKNKKKQQQQQHTDLHVHVLWLKLCWFLATFQSPQIEMLTLSLPKVIKVNVLPSNSTHRYEVHKGEHGILYFAQTIADVAISSHNITHTFSIWMVRRICILIIGVKGLIRFLSSQENDSNSTSLGEACVHMNLTEISGLWRMWYF